MINGINNEFIFGVFFFLKNKQKIYKLWKMFQYFNRSFWNINEFIRVNNLNKFKIIINHSSKMHEENQYLRLNAIKK